MEIFARAMEYARDASMLYGGYRLPIAHRYNAEGVGERRVAKQAIKILKMAISRAKDNGYEEDDAEYQQAVCDEVSGLNERYGKGWKLEDDGCYYKDFAEAHELPDVLIFLRELGVNWNQVDKTPIATAMHLRMPAAVFDMISSPATHDVNAPRSRRVG